MKQFFHGYFDLDVSVGHIFGHGSLALLDEPLVEIKIWNSGWKWDLNLLDTILRGGVVKKEKSECKLLGNMEDSRRRGVKTTVIPSSVA